MNNSVKYNSPKWGGPTKQVVALGFLALIILLVTFYHTVVGPLLIAFVISYLLHPVAIFMRERLKMPWTLAVNLIYLVFIVVLFTLAIMGGVFIINQMQGLIAFIQGAIKDLPTFLNHFGTQKISIGPFVFELSSLDTTLVNQLLATVQNLVGQLGTLLGQAASSMAVMFGWGFFIVMISYFVLAESKGAPEYLVNLNLPGYEDDLRKLQEQLSLIWNAFLRGQTIVTTLNIIIYTLILGGLGVQYFYLLAVAAGIARIIPYLGAWVSWITFGLVAFFQGYTIFGMDSFSYALMVLILAIISDSIMDNFITPRIMSNSLKVHPAAVMVAAIIGVSWLGIVGVILAAPVLATIKLFGNYALMKLSDKNPWLDMEVVSPRQEGAISGGIKNAWRISVVYFRHLFKLDSRQNQ